MDEIQLVTRLQALRAGLQDGSHSVEEGMNLLLERLYPKLVRFCRGLVRDPERAAEIAQEALLVAWRRLPDFEHRSSFSTWVSGIARMLARASHRKRSELLLEDQVLDAAHDGPLLTQYDGLRAEERQRVIEQAIATLPEEEQTALYLRYYEGLAVEDITELMGITQKSGARGVLVRSRRHLRDALRDIMEHEGLSSSFLHLTAEQDGRDNS